MDKKKELFMVMKLCKNIQVTDYHTGAEGSIQVEGLAGYIPVFENMEDAYEGSDNGKFSINIIQIT